MCLALAWGSLLQGRKQLGLLLHKALAEASWAAVRHQAGGDCQAGHAHGLCDVKHLQSEQVEDQQLAPRLQASAACQSFLRSAETRQMQTWLLTCGLVPGGTLTHILYRITTCHDLKTGNKMRPPARRHSEWRHMRAEPLLGLLCCVCGCLMLSPAGNAWQYLITGRLEQPQGA